MEDMAITCYFYRLCLVFVEQNLLATYLLKLFERELPGGSEPIESIQHYPLCMYTVCESKYMRLLFITIITLN